MRKWYNHDITLSIEADGLQQHLGDAILAVIQGKMKKFQWHLTGLEKKHDVFSLKMDLTWMMYQKLLKQNSECLPEKCGKMMEDETGRFAVGGHTQVLAAVSFRGCTPTISDFKHFEECYSLSLFWGVSITNEQQAKSHGGSCPTNSNVFLVNRILSVRWTVFQWTAKLTLWPIVISSDVLIW